MAAMGLGNGTRSSVPSSASTIGMVCLHLIYVGALFGFNSELRQQTLVYPWITLTYFLLLVVTLFQFWFTAGSDPGYLVDENTDAEFESKASSSNCEDLCTICHVKQPLRTKHCNDCKKCVLKFDHHCKWLGTCIGYMNHRRFWWFIFLETLICIWTFCLYATAFSNGSGRLALLQNVVVVCLLIFLLFIIFLMVIFVIFHSYIICTNQTTYEWIRRTRIHYMRGVPPHVNPFSKGCMKNIFSFCWESRTYYYLEQLPEMAVLNDRATSSLCERLYFNLCWGSARLITRKTMEI